MERLDQRAGALVVAILQRGEHAGDIFGLQPVILVQLRFGQRAFGFEFREFGVADLGLPRSIMNAVSRL